MWELAAARIFVCPWKPIYAGYGHLASDRADTAPRLGGTALAAVWTFLGKEI